MPRIQPVNIESAQGATAEVLNATKKKMGMVPNIVGTMANSPAVANAYLGFSGALAGGSLPAALREKIALVVGQENSCDYCLSAHTAIGKMSGLSEDDILQARRGTASNSKDAAAVEFARKLVANRGNVADADLEAVRNAGFGDGEIAEIVANVALNLFTNYFNHVTDPEIDFPVATPLAA